MYKTMKIYYDNTSGEPIYSSSYGYMVAPSLERDYEIIRELNERLKETIGLLVLSDGQYAHDFAESNGYRVNPETLELEFSYPDPNEPEVEQPYQAPLSEEVEMLKLQNEMLMIGVADTYETQQENADMLLNAVAEVYEILLGGAE